MKKELHFKAGELILRQGDPGGDLMIVREGVVAIFQMHQGHEVILAELGKDELLGAMSVFNKSKRSASAKALSDVEVTLIQAEDIEKMLSTIPQWAGILIKDLSNRLRVMNDAYIQTLTSDSHASTRNLMVHFAIRIARGMLANAPFQLEDSSHGPVVDFDACAGPLREVIQADKEAVDRVLKTFIQCKLVVFVKNNPLKRLVRKSELHSFQLFCNIAHAYMGLNHMLESRAKFAVGERKLLHALAERYEDQLTEKQDAIHINFADCYDICSAHKVSSENFRFFIKRAHTWNIAHLKKNDEKSFIFYPRIARHVYASLKAYMKLNQEEEKEESIEGESFPASDLEEKAG